MQLIKSRRAVVIMIIYAAGIDTRSEAELKKFVRGLPKTWTRDVSYFGTMKEQVYSMRLVGAALGGGWLFERGSEVEVNTVGRKFVVGGREYIVWSGPVGAIVPGGGTWWALVRYCGFAYHVRTLRYLLKGWNPGV